MGHIQSFLFMDTLVVMAAAGNMATTEFRFLSLPFRNDCALEEGGI